MKASEKGITSARRGTAGEPIRLAPGGCLEKIIE